MAHLYCNGGNRFNYVSIRNYTQNNFGGGYSYGCSMPSFGGIFSNWGTGIYNGCACNGGFNWSTFWGTGCGSLVGSFLGMLCRPNNTSGLNQGQRAAGNNGNDTDYKKINDLADEMKRNQTLISAKKICTLSDDCDRKILQAKLNSYREKIQNLLDNLDNKQDDQNKRQLDALKAQIDELDTKFDIDSTKSPEIGLTSEQKEGEKEQPQSSANATSNSAQLGTQLTTGKDTDTTTGSKKSDENVSGTKTLEREHNLTRSLTVPGDISWNTLTTGMIPEKFTLPPDYTKPEAKDIKDGCLIQVEDLSGKTNPIVVDICQVSDAGENTKDFPEILEITSRSGKKWYYHYEGVRGGYPVYITRDTDKNKNVYILCVQNGKLKLIQDEKFNGYGVPDTQNNK